LNNLSKVRLFSNTSLDDLLDLSTKFSLNVDTLEGWRLLKEGHNLAKNGNWKKAYKLVLKGQESLVNDSPSAFVWMLIGVV
jgi:hypothetical protein